MMTIESELELLKMERPKTDSSPSPSLSHKSYKSGTKTFEVFFVGSPADNMWGNHIYNKMCIFWGVTIPLGV